MNDYLSIIAIFKDIVMTTAAVIAGYVGIVGIKTWRRWLTDKRRDESYAAAKRYLAVLSRIEEIIREISRNCFHLSPSPGLVVEQKEISVARIERLHILCNDLVTARVDLNLARSELSFWKVKLSKDAETNHSSLTENLTDINTVMVGFNSQCYWYYVKGEDHLADIIQHKNLYDIHWKSVITCLNSRYTIGFENFFDF